jgi:hypothetical protein
LWDDVNNLLSKVLNYKSVRDDISPAELIAHLEAEVRETVREIKSIQEEAESPMSEAVDNLKAYLRNLMALVVRLRLMDTHLISIGICDTEDDFYDARADWFYKKLFKDPDFRIPAVQS